jgi:hypothetical protein
MSLQTYNSAFGTTYTFDAKDGFYYTVYIDRSDGLAHVTKRRPCVFHENTMALFISADVALSICPQNIRPARFVLLPWP